jgi:hypothetical protein
MGIIYSFSLLSEGKPEIILNKKLSHTILGVDLRKLPSTIILVFKIKIEQIVTPLISDYLCILMV